MRKLKKLWARRPRLSRGWQIARNLTAAALLLAVTWGVTGYPLPTAEMEFRQLERMHLLPRSEIIFDSRKDAPLRWRDLPELSFSWQELMIGVERDRVHVADLRFDDMEIWPLEEGITPVPLYNMMIIEQQPGSQRSGVALLFLNAPAEAERAEVEIDAAGSEGEALRYQGEGWRLAPGSWMFCVYPGDSFYGGWYANGNYTLRLYGADGSPLPGRSGTIPEHI